MKLFIFILLIPCLTFGKQVRIAVIDSGLTMTKGVKLCKPTKDLTGTGTQSESKHHGDNVTHIISDNLKNYCVYHIKAWSDTKQGSMSDAIYEAIRADVDIINISGGGPGQNKLERAAIRQAISRRILVVAAAGNDGKSLDKKCEYFPACYPEVIAVGNAHSSSNFGGKIEFVMDGVDVKAGGVTNTGTSQAAAMLTHELAESLEKK